MYLYALRAVAVVMAASAASALAQSTYPTKPIRLINPFPPGGGATIIGRVIAQELTELFWKPLSHECSLGWSLLHMCKI